MWTVTKVKTQESFSVVKSCLGSPLFQIYFKPSDFKERCVCKRALKQRYTRACKYEPLDSKIQILNFPVIRNYLESEKEVGLLVNLGGLVK